VEFELLKIILDTALCTLIWLVQIVIYPGLLYYSEPDVKKWHRTYTGRITFIVMPLMLGQLLVYLAFAYYYPNFYSIAGLGMVLLVWAITFFISVPLHTKIDESVDSTIVRKKLVYTNWSRTLVWTLVLLLSILYYGK